MGIYFFNDMFLAKSPIFLTAHRHLAQSRVKTMKRFVVVPLLASPFISMAFESMHPSRSVEICGAPNSTTSGEKMDQSQKKFSPFTTFPSHEGIYSEEGRGFHRTALSELTSIKSLRHLIPVFRSGTSNDQVESENIQVFLNFSGETRAGFTSYLHKELTQAGYSTFIDRLMKRGVIIYEELLRAIRNAKLSVVVISPEYASSQSCLDELVAILYERHFGHEVLPVFCHVDPDNVSSLTGNFGAAFDGLVEHLEDTTENKIMVHRWKKALKEVAGISGLVLREHQCESEFIDQIVAEVNQLLNPLVPLGTASWRAAPRIEFYMITGCSSYSLTVTVTMQRVSLNKTIEPT